MVHPGAHRTVGSVGFERVSTHHGESVSLMSPKYARLDPPVLSESADTISSEIGGSSPPDSLPNKR